MNNPRSVQVEGLGDRRRGPPGGATAARGWRLPNREAGPLSALPNLACARADRAGTIAAHIFFLRSTAIRRRRSACSALAPPIFSGAMWVVNNPIAVRAQSGRRRRAWRIGVTIALTLSAPSFVLRLAAPAHAQSPLIQGWLAANTECKGGRGDDPKTQRACEKRDQLSARLKRRGCLYQENGDWWKCPH